MLHEFTKKLTNPTHTSCPAAWNHPARRNLPFLLSSFAIGLLGIALLYKGWLLPGILIMMQTVASFMADVWNCGLPSVWHGIDKQLAVVSALSVLYFLVVSTTDCASHSSVAPLLRFLLTALAPLAIAAGCYRKSVVAQKSSDMEGFFFHHACWHYAVSSGCVAVLMEC